MSNCGNTDILNHFGGLEINSLLSVPNIKEDNNEFRTIQHSPYYMTEEFISHLQSFNSNFIVLSLNVQSINAKYDHIVSLVDMLFAQNRKIDAICLQETWLGTNDNLSLFQLPNYHLISQPKHCSSHAGLAVYLLNDYSFNTMDLSDVWESLFVEIPASIHNKHIILGNIYKPPKDNNNNTNIGTFISELSHYLTPLCESNANVIITGDFIINLLHLKNRLAFRAFFDLMISNDFSPQ